MGLAHSPKTITDGLVFAYDMANVNKSWKGKPTENLIAISGSDASIVRSGVGYSYYGVNINTVVQSRWTSVNNQLTLSFEGKRDYSVGGTGGGNDGYPQAYVYFSDWSWAVAVGVDTYSWSRNSVSFTMPDPTGKTVIFDIYHMNAGNPGFSYSRNHQVEFSTYATPFVNGTRTTTQALLDLTRQNTITATGLRYSSNGTFEFAGPGSGNYLDCGNSTQLQIATNVTLEAWVKADTSNGLGNIIQKNGNGGYRMRIENENFWMYAGGNYVVQTGGGCTNNVWHHVVAVFSSTGLRAYVDGVLVASNSTAYNQNPTLGNLQIGTVGDSAELFDGRIDIAKVYNKALTEAEVLQNFNALRGRYGV